MDRSRRLVDTILFGGSFFVVVPFCLAVTRVMFFIISFCISGVLFVYLNAVVMSPLNCGCGLGVLDGMGDEDGGWESLQPPYSISAARVILLSSSIRYSKANDVHRLFRRS